MMIPFIRYKKAKEVIEWLQEAFGFELLEIHTTADRVDHAQLRFADAIMMVGSEDNPGPLRPYMIAPSDIQGRTTLGIYIPVDDVETHYKKSTSKNAVIIAPLSEKPYGGKDYTCQDPEGYIWSFGTYRPSHP